MVADDKNDDAKKHKSSIPELPVFIVDNFFTFAVYIANT